MRIVRRQNGFVPTSSLKFLECCEESKSSSSASASPSPGGADLRKRKVTQVRRLIEGRRAKYGPGWERSSERGIADRIECLAITWRRAVKMSCPSDEVNEVG